MEAGTDGLLVDKTRPSRIPPLDAAVIERAVALTLTEPPGETTHWTAAAVAASCSISISSVHRIWRSHGLRLHQNEKSQNPGAGSHQPGLPLKKRRCGTMTHDYKRNGTTTLFAAFSVLEGSVILLIMDQRRRGC